jgi:hypothetical protein
VTGSKGTSFVFIGHRWGASGPPFPNATSIWLPMSFGDGGAIIPLQWVDSWMLDTDGGEAPSV